MVAIFSQAQDTVFVKNIVRYSAMHAVIGMDLTGSLVMLSGLSQAVPTAAPVAGSATAAICCGTGILVP